MSSQVEISPDSSAVVLLSAGLDSTFNLIKALENLKVCLVLTFTYGQKAAANEVKCASLLAKHFGLRHEVVELPWFSKFTHTALLSRDSVPSEADVEIDNLNRSLETAKNVWVPNRNGIFLNIAAGFAEGLGAELVIPGFNLEEAQTFPDNSSAFLKTLDDSWSLSTSTGVRTHCYSTDLNKTQIVKEGMRLGLPFGRLWPCYLSGPRWCGVCESCLRFKRAIKANGLEFAQLQESV